MYRLTFEDHGQDFLEWVVFNDGRVVWAGPFQADIWDRMTVDSPALLVPGEKVHFRNGTSGPRRVVRYPLEKAEHLHAMDWIEGDGRKHIGVADALLHLGNIGEDHAAIWLMEGMRRLAPLQPRNVSRTAARQLVKNMFHTRLSNHTAYGNTLWLALAASRCLKWKVDVVNQMGPPRHAPKRLGISVQLLREEATVLSLLGPISIRNEEVFNAEA